MRPSIKVVEDYGINVPFIRPKKLAQDNSSSESAILHAVDFYEKTHEKVDYVVLLQPTSPFRTSKQIQEAIELFKNNEKTNIVVSVKTISPNKFDNILLENKNGYLTKVNSNLSDSKSIYQYNGAIYVMKVDALRKHKSHMEFENIVKYKMDDYHSVDIDTIEDWKYAEELIKNKTI